MDLITESIVHRATSCPLLSAREKDATEYGVLRFLAEGDEEDARDACDPRHWHWTLAALREL
jgi:hypothetical protein